MNAPHNESEQKRHVLYARSFAVQAEFPDTEEGVKQANELMLKDKALGVLEVTEGRIILAAVSDKGVEVKKPLSPEELCAEFDSESA